MYTPSWKMQTTIKSPVANFMTKEVVTVAKSEKFSRVRALLVEKNVRHLPVIDKGVLVGMISNKDVLHHSYSRHMDVDERLENADLDNRITAETMMSTQLVTIQDTDPTHQAVELLAQHRLNALPVVSDAGCLVGIITTTDILKLMLAHL